MTRRGRTRKTKQGACCVLFCSGGAITSDRLQRILHVCDDLSLEWFFFGTGDMFRSRGGDTTYNYGKYAGADIVRDKGVMVKSDSVHL